VGVGGWGVGGGGWGVGGGGWGVGGGEGYLANAFHSYLILERILLFTFNICSKFNGSTINFFKQSIRLNVCFL
jgi:hypothetical protein